MFVGELMYLLLAPMLDSRRIFEYQSILMKIWKLLDAIEFTKESANVSLNLFLKECVSSSFINPLFAEPIKRLTWIIDDSIGHQATEFDGIYYFNVDAKIKSLVKSILQEAIFRCNISLWSSLYSSIFEFSKSFNNLFSTNSVDRLDIPIPVGNVFSGPSLLVKPVDLMISISIL